jgi:hypothetical protein
MKMKQLKLPVATPYEFNFNQSTIYDYVNLSNLYSWLGNGYLSVNLLVTRN